MDPERQPAKFSISVIIPMRVWDERVVRCIASCILSHRACGVNCSLEILLVPDAGESLPCPLPGDFGSYCRIIGGVAGYPGHKRNVAAAESGGDILAFIDADAEADRLWLSAATSFFSDSSVAVVGGPNLVPPSSSERRIAGWEILASPLLSGSLCCRYRPCPPHDRREVQSSNMFIRHSLFREIRGFRTDILTGEDSDLCFRLYSKGHRVRYEPSVVVYHEPRPLFVAHFKQMYGYGFDQARILSSLPLRHRLMWLLPVSGVGLYLMALLLALVGKTILFQVLTVGYCGWIMAGAVLAGPPGRFIVRLVGTVGTHCSYAAGFIHRLLLMLIHSTGGQTRRCNS